jgi:hypothetical protein
MSYAASHIPVLVTLAEHFEPKKVLEIGAGELSTPLFLNKKIFTRLESLVSVEEDYDCIVKVTKIIGVDKRLEFRRTVPASLYDYDLIFVDGPQDKDKREKTIRFVMRETIAPLIVIHESESYRSAINKAFYSFPFDFTYPQTKVCSKDNLPTVKFKRLNSFIKRNFDKIQGDALAWKPLLR